MARFLAQRAIADTEAPPVRRPAKAVQMSQGKTQLILRPGMRVHLVGIGGSGLSAVAWVLLGRHYIVSGSDQVASATTRQLAAAGAAIAIGHRAENVAGAEIILISSAVLSTNPEVQAARAAGILVVKRADFLGALMAGAEGIAIAGSHGKTTTTGLIAQILLAAGLDPSVIMGSDLPAVGRNGRAGRGPHFVIEADEYDHMFLGLRPQIAVVTNVEYDHPDLFADVAAYRAAFRRFVELLPAGGRLVVCADDAGAMAAAESASLPGVAIERYGLGPAEWQALDLRPNPLGGSDFLAQRNGEVIGLARLRLPGQHNVRNALAALAVCHGLGVEFDVIRQALADFGGVSRRFQVIGEAGDVAVIDDYAHHPTEIRATLAAARQRYPGRRLWAVWQPHTYSRTQSLLADFAASFGDADRVVVVDIYRSRESESLGLGGAGVAAAITHPDVAYVAGLEEAAGFILDRLRPGDVLLTLSAGDANQIGQWVLAALRQSRAEFSPPSLPTSEIGTD